MPRYHQHVSGLKYVFGAKQFMTQLRRSAALAEKIRAAVIMQAWIDGCEVVEHMDEIVIEKPGEFVYALTANNSELCRFETWEGAMDCAAHLTNKLPDSRATYSVRRVHREEKQT